MSTWLTRRPTAGGVRSVGGLRLDSVIVTGHRSNNFDLLRLFAALLVLFDHSFQVLGLTAPFPRIYGVLYGSTGVLIFFSISGFLIARSWVATPLLVPFVIKRALRIVPALVACVLVTALLLGPLVTTEPARAYLEHPATKAYVVNNATFQTNYILPGVFTELPLANSVNGPLWTLQLELKAYAFLAFIGLLGLLTRRKLGLVAISIILVLLTIDGLRADIPGANRIAAMLWDLQGPVNIVYLMQQGVLTIALVPIAAFFVGATLFAFRKSIVLRWDFAALAFLAWLGTLMLGDGAARTATALLCPYLVLVIAYRTHHLCRLPSWMGDYSYGMYLYGFPVQQTILVLVAPSSGWVVMLIALPISTALGVASWHFIESTSLKHKPAPTARLEVAPSST